MLEPDNIGTSLDGQGDFEPGKPINNNGNGHGNGHGSFEHSNSQFGESTGGNGHGNGVSLEEELTLGEQKMSMRQQDSALIDEARRKQRSSLSSAEDAESKITLGGGDLCSKFENAIEDAVKAYKGDVPRLKDAIFRFARDFGFNGYKWEAKRILGQVKRELAVLQRDSSQLEERLSEENMEGIVYKTHQFESLASQFAHAIFDTRALRENYGKSLAAKNQELTELEARAKQDRTHDYSADIAFVNREIKNLQKDDRRALSELGISENKFMMYRQEYKTSQGILAMVENAHNACTNVYALYLSRVKMVETLIDAGYYSASIAVILERTGQAVGHAKGISKVESILGNSFAQAIDDVGAQAEQLQKKASHDQEYLTRVGMTRNASKQENDARIDSFLKEFIPSYR